MSEFVVHCKREPYDIYVGRPSCFGNPYSHKEGTLARWTVSTVDEAIEAYRAWVVTQPEIMAKIPELKGKILGCWCVPYHRCHGEVLAELANREDSE